MAQSHTSSHELNRRLLHYRSHPAEEDAIELAEALLRENRLGDARGVLVSAQPLEGESTALLVLEGRAWLQEGHADRALEKFVQAIALDPEDSAAYLGLGEGLFARRDLVRARAALERALLLDQECAGAAATLLEVQEALAQSEAAARVVEAEVTSEEQEVAPEADQAAGHCEPVQALNDSPLVGEILEVEVDVAQLEAAAEPDPLTTSATERPSAPLHANSSPAIDEILVDIEPRSPILESIAEQFQDDACALMQESDDVSPPAQQVLPPASSDLPHLLRDIPQDIPSPPLAAFEIDTSGPSLRPIERRPSWSRRPASGHARRIALAAALCGAGLGYLSLQFAEQPGVAPHKSHQASQPTMTAVAIPEAQVIAVSNAPAATPAAAALTTAGASASEMAAVETNDGASKTSRSSDDEGARLARAEAALLRGNSQQALRELEPLRQAERHTVRMLGVLGRALYAAGHVNAAAGAYDIALSKDSGDAVALIGRAEVHIRASHFEEAIDMLMRAEKKLSTTPQGPSFVRPWMLTLLGHAYLQRRLPEDRDRAVEVLTQATASKDAPAEAYFWLGESLSSHRSSDAMVAYRAYLERSSEGRYAIRAHRALRPLL